MAFARGVSSYALETVPAPLTGHWEWDDNERGIVLNSQDGAPRDVARGASRVAVARSVRGGSGCLLSNLDVAFQDVVDALDQMRFKRHWQRRVQPGQMDVVILRDIKDVVLFQVQQALPAGFLVFFHTPAVDRFLRTLILYCYHYIQTWEWVTFTSMLSENKIREPGLRPTQKRHQRNLGILRVLLARDYHVLLMGEGKARKFHHMANGVQSWSQRDAHLWELLLRLAVRVTWVALQRRYLNLIDAEVGRLFRGEPFNLAARRLQAATFLAESLRRLEAAYTLSEEELVREHASFIGILGMPRNHLDVMLNIKDKQRRQELLLSTAGSSFGQQCSSLFPLEDQESTLAAEPQPEPQHFPFPQ